MRAPYHVLRSALGLTEGGVVQRDHTGCAWLSVRLPDLTPEVAAVLVKHGILSPVRSPLPVRADRSRSEVARGLRLVE